MLTKLLNALIWYKIKIVQIFELRALLQYFHFQCLVFLQVCPAERPSSGSSLAFSWAQRKKYRTKNHSWREKRNKIRRNHKSAEMKMELK